MENKKFPEVLWLDAGYFRVQDFLEAISQLGQHQRRPPALNSNHRVHIFTRDETGLVCTPHPHQPGLILTS